MTQEDLFKNLIAHTKEYGYIFPSSEIYDGLGAVYDYGQLGSELKNNIKRYWWEAMVRLNENIVGIDSAIFMHPRIWEASGHVGAFNDPLIDNKDSKKRYRADVLLEDYIAKLEEKINKDDAYAFLNEYFMVRVPARNLEESTKFLENVAAKNKNVIATESGLLYEIVEMGDTTAMAKGLADEVFVNYKGTLKDGEVFDENDSIRFRLGQVVQGWQEGLQLVGKGGKINLWIPPHLGYGQQARGKIKANDALVFEVELLDVTPAEAR